LDKAREIHSRERRKELLARQTGAEKRLAVILKNLGIRACPQAVFFLDDYHYRIVDFYLPKPYRIIVELDGSVHDSQDAKNYDAWKDQKLKTAHHRFRILRFKNDEVFENGFVAKFLQRIGKYKVTAKRFKRIRRFKLRRKMRKYLKDKPKNGKSLNLGWRIVKINQVHRAKYPGFEYQKGYSLSEMKQMGLL
jgi:very-short-patch-repair endonuclease